MVILIIIAAPFIIGFILGVIDGLKNAKTIYKDRYNYYTADAPETDMDENTREKIDNYDRQIDGYTQLIKLLDIAFHNETDPRRQAIILNRQLATLEKLNKTIEKREKLE